MGFGIEALSLINEAFPSVMAVSANFIFVNDGLAGKFPLGKGPIFAGDFFVLQEAVENGEDKGIFGEKDGATGFFVQTVNDIAGLTDIASSSRIPAFDNSIAMFKPVCPPSVGKRASGRSLRRMRVTNSSVIGSM